MVEVISSVVNPSRVAMPKRKQKTFEFNSCFVERNLSTGSAEYGEPDVVFVLGRDVLHGHQSVFSSTSQIFKHLFEIMNSEDCSYYVDPSGVLRLSKPVKGSRKVFVDASLSVFEPIFHYCYSGRLSVLMDLVPSVYLLTKRLGIMALQVALANHLSNNVTVSTIGEFCRMTPLAQVSRNLYLGDTKIIDVVQAERHLALSICHFVQTNADAVACSLTGQLSARLIVNLTMECVNSSVAARYPYMNTLPPQSDAIAFAVLKWAHQRLLSGQRLARVGSEENVQPDDEESDGGTGPVGVASGTACNSVSFGRKGFGSLLPAFGFISQLNKLSTVEQQRVGRTNSGQLLSSDEEDDIQPDSDSHNSPLRVPTHDVRITVDLSELDCQCVTDDNSTNDAPNNTTFDSSPVDEKKIRLLTYCHPDSVPESESCLLARTSLGVGSTSIWLGKLMGHLVSLSIKRCRPAPYSTGNSNGRYGLRSVNLHSDSGEANTSEDEVLRKRSHSANAMVPLDSYLASEVLGDDEVALTMTAECRSHLAKAAAIAQHSRGDRMEEYHNGFHSPNTDAQRDDSVTPPCHLLEGRSGAGAGVLSVGEDEYLIVAGGYTRKGCLDKVELFRRTDIETLDSPIAGPRLSKQRGRVGLASTSVHLSYPHSDTVYACGGSTGSMDLSSVERLTSESLHAWLTARASSEHLDYSLSARSPHHSGGSSGGGSGSSGSSIVWQSVARLNQPRSSPTALGLSGLKTGPFISDSRGSLMVAGGLVGAEALLTAEALIPERDQWVSLPNMREGRFEASSSLITSHNLIVVAGGNANASRLDRSDAFIEALDPRCAEWFYLPSPSPGAGGQLRGTALVSSPTNKDNLLLIGGFNGQETLSTMWIFDVTAWHWVPGPSLQIPRANHCAITWPNRLSTVVLGGFNPSACKTGFLSSVELISSHSAYENPF